MIVRVVVKAMVFSVVVIVVVTEAVTEVVAGVITVLVPVLQSEDLGLSTAFILANPKVPFRFDLGRLHCH